MKRFENWDWWSIALSGLLALLGALGGYGLAVAIFGGVLAMWIGGIVGWLVAFALFTGASDAFGKNDRMA